VDETYMNLLREQGVKDSVKIEGGEEEFQRSLPEIKKQLKHLIARDIWDMSEFMMIYNRTSDTFIKAYELVKERDLEQLMLKEEKK
jgi:carboxyl-terminal processing protease